MLTGLAHIRCLSPTAKGKSLSLYVQSFAQGHYHGLHADDHVDNGRGMFLSRLEWDLDGFDIPIANFAEHFKPLAEQYRIEYHLAPTGCCPRLSFSYRPMTIV